MQVYLGAIAVIGCLLIVQGCGKEQADSGSSAPQAAVSPDKSEFDKTYQNAVTELEQITKDGNAWRDTGEFLKQAQAAADSNDYSEALKLAKKAQEENQMAKAQLEDQKNAGPRF